MNEIRRREEKLNQRQILITGAHGFIGSHFTSSVEDRSYAVLERSLLEDPDYLNKLVKNSEVVVHLAAQIQGDESKVIEGNVGFTRNLLEAIARVEGRKQTLIFASTFAVYAPQEQTITEETSTEPRNVYGKAKLQTEKLIKEYAKKHGIPVLILRFANVYGPGMPPYRHSVVATFINQAMNNKPFTLNGDGTQERDFVYVDDVVDAINKAVNWKGKPGQVEILNICSGERVAMKELIRRTIRLTGSKSRVEYPNPDAKEEGFWIGDNRKARRILNWKPVTSLNAGLKLAYDALKKT